MNLPKSPIVFSLFFLLLLASSCQSKLKTVRLEASFEQAPGDSFYISEIYTESIQVLDTLIADQEGSIRWKTKTWLPSFYILERQPDEQLVLILHPGEKVSIRGDISDPLDQIEIEGSVDSKRLLRLNRTLTQNYIKLDSLLRSYSDSAINNPQPDFMEELNDKALAVVDHQREYNIRFIKEDPGSLANLVALFQNITYDLPVLDLIEDYELFREVDSNLYARFPDLESIQNLHQNILTADEYFKRNEEKEKLVGLGCPAPDIRMPTPDGDTLSLSSTLGHVVLLDFWASWNPPSREIHPDLVRLYSRYSKKGFRIFQVSLDQDQEAWIKAIKEDGLTSFAHVCDLLYLDSPVLWDYYIESIPTNFLLDENGLIIGRDLTLEELEQKLSEVFENPQP